MALDCTEYDTAPDAALAAIRGYRGLALIDLDDTLYLRNSTEDFLDCARPAALARMLLKSLDAIAPWRWTGGLPTRDVWRVRGVGMLLPWTWLKWRRRVGTLAAAHTNKPLLAALKDSPCEAVIATIGFDPIVQPLLHAIGVGERRCLAANHRSFRDRRTGKLAMAIAAMGPEAIRQSLVLTDASEDLPLLRHCALPLRTIWPEARFRRALGEHYLPSDYLTTIKRPGERYIVRGILQDDFAYWVLASASLAPNLPLHVLGLIMLLASFWCVYELGYVDNDRMAARHEAEPKLNAAHATSTVATPAVEPWVWAGALGLAGVMLLRTPGAAPLLGMAKWMAVLLATHLWFRLYNRVDKLTRVWMYPLLQLARAAAFVVLVPVSPIGAAALAGHTLARWVPYYNYRVMGGSWPEARPQVMQLLFIVVISLVLATALGPSMLFSWSALGILLWSLYRARTELRTTLDGAARIDRARRAP